MTDPNTRPPNVGTIDTIDALRLLRDQADPSVRPIIQGAIDEIQALRKLVQIYHNGDTERAFS